MDTGNRLTETYLRRLKDLADAAGVAWRYAPLHYFLNHPEEAGVKLPVEAAKVPAPAHDSRRPLPII